MEQKVKDQLAKISGTNPDNWFLISRARHGMTEIFECLEPGEVITQPFTCITAINPILESGHRPIYCDINQRTFSINPELITQIESDSIRSVVVQHSFGIPADAESIRKLLPRPVLLLEDSAHRLGYLSRYSESSPKKDQPIADVSVHSFGAEKSLSTRYGAAVWLNPELDEVIYKKIKSRLDNLPRVAWHFSVRLRLYPLLNKITNLVPIFRDVLEKSQLMIAPIMPTERTAGKNFKKASRLPKWAVRHIASELTSFQETEDIRIEQSKAYQNALELPDLLGEIPLVRMPMLCSSPTEAEVLFDRLSSKGLAPGKWYRPLLFPGTSSGIYNFKPGQCPVAEDISSRMINFRLGANVNFATIEASIHEIKS